uniref:Complex 1 LYR protein domain-containing protein n=1 Tax=Setaria italica TaxID=4555 RepID=K3ZAW1_SETIT
MAAAAEGLAAYRLVLRAARRTFAGDRLMLQESAVEIRRRFEDHRGLAPGSDELARALEDAREAAFFIGHGIVQATRGPSGSFGLMMKIWSCISIALELACLEKENYITYNFMVC